MPVFIDLKNNHLNCVAWLEGNELKESRNDLVFFTVSFEPRTINGILFEDIGELIPQPLGFEIINDAEFSNYYACSHKGEQFSRFISYCLLSNASHRPLIDSFSKSSVSRSELDHFGLGRSFESEDNGIKLPSHVLEYGLTSGLLFRDPRTQELKHEMTSRFNFRSGLSPIAIYDVIALYPDLRTKPFVKELTRIDRKLAIEVLRLSPSPTAKAVSFYCDLNNPFHKFRTQAANAYPLLVEYFLQFDDLIQCIDKQKELNKTLSKLTGLNQGKLKRLSKFKELATTSDGNDDQAILHGLLINRFRRFRIQQSFDPNSIIQTINKVESNLLPNSNSEWNYFLKIHNACLLPLESQFGMAPEQLVQSTKGSWERYYNSLANTIQIPLEGFHVDHLTTAIQDSIEAVDSFMRSVLLPQLLTDLLEKKGEIPQPENDLIQNAFQESFNLLMGNSKNIISLLLRLGVRWVNRIRVLQNLQNLDSSFENEEDDSRKQMLNKYKGSWPILAQDFNFKNKLLIRNLSSKRELMEETNRLGHCVGTHYVRDAMRGKCHIFSIQSLDGKKSYSTFEISPPKEDDLLNSMGLRQHKAKNNAKPSKHCKEALEAWIETLQRGELVLNDVEVLKWQEVHKLKKLSENAWHRLVSPKKAWMLQLGQNWCNKTVQNSVFNEWDQHVHKIRNFHSKLPEISKKIFSNEN